MNEPMKLQLLKPLILLSSVTLGIGITAPTITITPQIGEFTGDLSWVIEHFYPDKLAPKTYSVIGTIGLIIKRDWLLGVGLIVFSIIFPVTKLGFYWLSASGPAGKSRARTFLGGIERFGKFSMAEVFLLALIMLFIKDLPGMGAKLHYGIYVFSASVILSLLISILMPKNPAEETAELEAEESTEEDTAEPEAAEEKSAEPGEATEGGAAGPEAGNPA